MLFQIIRISVNKMEERDKKIISDFKDRISKDIDKYVKKIFVFGSRVKGEATIDSDLDIAALIDERNPKIEELLENNAYQVMWDNDFKPIISLKVFVESEFMDAVSKGFSFYRNIIKNGISV